MIRSVSVSAAPLRRPVASAAAAVALPQSLRRRMHQRSSASAPAPAIESAAAAVSLSALPRSSSHSAGCACCARPTLRPRAALASAPSSAISSARPLSSASASASSPSSGPTMLAQVLTSASPSGWSMRLEELRRPRPKRGEVLVKVRACGVCHTDLHVLKGEVGFPIPAVLGHEISGEIVEIGEGVAAHAATKLAVGQRVVCPFIMPCGECFECASGAEDLCSTFFALNRGQGALYDGTSRLARATDGTSVAQYSMGGLAQYSVLPATAVYPLPSCASAAASDYAASAILGCAVFTAYGAVRNAAHQQSGESVAVIGVGGVGSSIVALASRAFCASQTIAIDVASDKLSLARDLGATHTIDARTEDVQLRLRQITEGRGVDVAYEALGRADTFASAVAAVRDGGRAVMVGIAPTGVTASVDITRLVRRQIKIVGSYGAKARTDMPAILSMLQRGHIHVSKAVTRTFSLADAGEAYSLLDQGRIVGRAVIDMEM